MDNTEYVYSVEVKVSCPLYLTWQSSDSAIVRVPLLQAVTVEIQDVLKRARIRDKKINFSGTMMQTQRPLLKIIKNI